MVNILLLSLACAPYPEGLRKTPPGNGPEVRVDWDAEPLPDIPYPNDLATTVDATSPTGLRLNVPLAANTHMEEVARIKLNQLTGFGIYSPIAVGFSEPLDLDNLAARHTYDDALGDAQFQDDAVFLIDVTPGSPTYQELIPLDMGQGRYPMDAARGDRYFPNDTRAEHPSVIFDTVDEDLNGNGKLDWGEDTDNDGVLDKPNVYPEGGDPRDDLLSWYERQTNTLIVRPVRPLREETTYAVVVTERVIGEDGEPVRSPWEYVHHLRQTQALEPAPKALSKVGLGLQDIAYAWVYTTGRITGDLVDARIGLQGKGSLAALDKEFPEGVNEALSVNAIPGEDPLLLPVDSLIGTLASLGLFSGESADVLVANYSAFATHIVGGSFDTPNFFGDLDHDPGPWPEVDDSNDFWQIDGHNGWYKARAERVPFSCVLPKNVPQPAPVAIFGHGYGSSRFDFLGFAWAMTRMGYAACAFDYPGHGPTLSAEDQALVESVLGPTGLVPFYEHLKDSRYRDLDYDGRKDSGGDQWSADAFHTRDMVRQAAIDHAQFIDTLMACGDGEWTKETGGTGMSCDWNGDGTPDLGGPDVEYVVLGGSLGGINTAVAAAVIDEVSAWAPVVPGGGLLDVAFRTEIGGAVEAMHGRLLSPLILGIPNDAGQLEVVQMVNTVADMVSVPIATLDSFPAGGRIIVENLDNGVVREGYIPENGTFRVGIAADAAPPWEKARVAGIPPEGYATPLEGPSPFTIDDPTEVGDRLVIRLETESGDLVHEIDTFETSVTFQGVAFPAGSTLVAAAEGLGHVRASPEVRRIGFVFSAILEPGDAIAYARGFDEEPLPGTNGKPRNIMLVPTPGDTIVNISTGIALARAAGWISDDEVDPRYGTSVDRWLIEKKVVQGLEQYGPYTCNDGEPCLFDADDLDEGLDGTGATSEAPLRLNHAHSSGMSALRLPYVRTTGTHGFATPRPEDPFDISTYAVMQICTYFQSGGQEVVDDLCFEDASCSWIPQLPDDGTTDGGGR